jgi:hypothetical protein
MTDPERIMVAGDWHGNGPWATHVIGRLAELLRGNSIPTIVHLGDFGVWAGQHGDRYLQDVSLALRHANALLYFVDGNHEDFRRLQAALEHAERTMLPGRSSIPVENGIQWMRRGARWTWQGRRWLACGGAVSLDKAARTEGHDWWPEEEITAAEEQEIIAAGPADVIVTHDCPAGVRHSFPPPPYWWDVRDMARSDAHQERLQRIVDAVQPRWILHGHLHRSYARTVDFGYGPVQVTGLNCDGQAGNYAVLNVKTMTWETTS